MKTAEDEAFEDIERKQGMWGGGFNAKRKAAMDKRNAMFYQAYKKLSEDQINYGSSWSKDGERIDPASVYLEEPAHCQCPACKDGVLHASDCAVHNGPAYPAGSCDCGVAQEPIAYVTGTYGGRFVVAPLNSAMVLPVGMALYTTSPKREWVGLTEEEREQHRNDWHSNIHDKEFYAIEAKLKEKNT